MQVSRKSYKAMLNGGIYVWAIDFQYLRTRFSKVLGYVLALHYQGWLPSTAPWPSHPHSAPGPEPRIPAFSCCCLEWRVGFKRNLTQKTNCCLGTLGWVPAANLWEVLCEMLYLGWFSTVQTSFWFCLDSQTFQCIQPITWPITCNVGSATLRHGPEHWAEPRPDVLDMLCC